MASSSASSYGASAGRRPSATIPASLPAALSGARHLKSSGATLPLELRNIEYVEAFSTIGPRAAVRACACLGSKGINAGSGSMAKPSDDTEVSMVRFSLTRKSEPPHSQLSLRRRCGIHFLMFQNPRIPVRHENRVQSCRQRRINIRPRAVSNHPGRLARQFMLFDQPQIRFGILLRHDLGRREISLQPRALDLSRLLLQRTLGYQDQAMPRRKILQSLRDLRQKFNRMVQNQVCETGNLRM